MKKNILKIAFILNALLLISCAKSSDDSKTSNCNPEMYGTWFNNLATFNFDQSCNGSGDFKVSNSTCQFNFNYSKTGNENVFLMNIIQVNCDDLFSTKELLCTNSIKDNIMELNCGADSLILVKK